MSTAPITALELIEHLDFELEVPCEGNGGACEAPADYLAEHRCPACGYHKDGASKFVCDEHWSGRSRKPRRCAACSHVHPHGDAWRIVEVLR